MKLRYGLLVVLSLACARVSEQQVVRAPLPNTEMCVIPQETVRVLPASGFSRNPLQSWTQTRFNAGPNSAIEDYADCLYWVFDSSFLDLLGPDPVIYQVGPTTDTYTYTETPAFLPGERINSCPDCWLLAVLALAALICSGICRLKRDRLHLGRG